MPNKTLTNAAQSQALTAYEINNRLFFRFFQAANTLHTKGTNALADFGVTTQQWSVLGALSREQAGEGMAISALSEYLLVSRQNLTGLLSRLEREGIVRRVADAVDRRSVRVQLTPKGKKLWLSLGKPIHTFYDEALKGFSVDDRIAFIHYVNMLQKNMVEL
jgi:MarR family transcriptional regulator, organic hydroperoxide resistance regulator